MKRITKSIKRFDLYASLIDLVFIVAAAWFGLHLFSLLAYNVDDITEVLTNDYTLFNGVVISYTTTNIIISLIVGYLLVFVPTAVGNFKRVFDKETIEIEAWDYRSQILYAFMSLFTFNPFSFVLRMIIANKEMRIIKECNLWEGFIELLKSIGRGFVKLVEIIKNVFKKKEKSTKVKTVRDKNEKFVQSQVDIEKANKRAFFNKLILMGMTYTFLTFIAIFIFIPFYWMIITALKTHEELSTAINPRFFIGLEEMQWVNWKVALTNPRYNFLSYIGNTLFVGIVSMIGTVLTTILAAFAFSRLEFKGREFMFSVLLMTMMIPGELYTITNYITVRNLGWYDSFTALIFPFMTSVFYIFFLRQSFKQIPDSLYRAAQVDGCGDFKYLNRVMIPIARPTITTIMILSAIGAWDAYIWPQLVTPSKQYWLVSVALRSTSFTTGVGSDARPVYNVQLAATALVTLPLLIIFFSLKKYIIRGVGRSGTKG